MAVPAVTNNSPVAGSIAWAAFTIQYNGVGYAISAGSTAQKWVWWRYNAGASVIEAGANVPSNLTDDDLVLFGNKSGVAVRIQSTSFVDGELLVDGSIVAEALATDSVTTRALAAGSVTVDELAAGSVSTSKLAALVGILGTLLIGDGSGRTITMDPVNGINVVDQYGASVFQVPTSLLSDINMTADVVARSLTALGVVAMRNPINELSPGAGFYIRKGTTAPRTPLAVTMSNPKLNAPDLNYQTSPGAGAYWNGLFYTVINNDTTIAGHGTVASGMSIVSFAHKTTGAMTYIKDVPNVIPTTDYGGQLFRLKSTTQAAGVGAWGFAYLRQGTTDTMRIRILDESFNNLATPKDFVVSEMTQAYINAYRHVFFSLASDEFYVNMWITPPEGSAGSLIQYTYNWQAATPQGAGGGTTPSFAAGTYFMGVMSGMFDYGGVNFRNIVVHQGGFNVLDNTTNHVRVPAEEFPSPVGADWLYGAFWDSSTGQFYSMDYNQVIFKHSKYTWTDVPHDTLRVSAAWETTAPAGATTEGPVTQFTAKKRQYINVSIPPLPGGVNQARVFFGYGTPDGGRTTHWSNGVTASAQMQVETPIFTGTNPVTVATIADSSPAFIQVDALDAGGQPIFKINGDGSGRMGPFAWDNTGSPTTVVAAGFRSIATDQNLPASATWYTLALDGTPDHNVGGATIAANVVTIPISGVYKLDVSVLWKATTLGSTNRRIAQIERWAAGASTPVLGNNPNALARTDASAWGTATVAGYSMSVLSIQVALTAGDRLRVDMYQSSGAALAIDNSTSLSQFNLHKIA